MEDLECSTWLEHHLLELRRVDSADGLRSTIRLAFATGEGDASSGDAGGGGAVLVRCVPAKRVGRVIVASWARLTTFLGVPPRGFERSDGWLSPASLLRSLPMRTFDLVWVPAAAAPAAPEAAEVVTEAAAAAAAAAAATSSLSAVVSGEKEAEERADVAAMAEEVSARVVGAALTAAVAVEGAETEGSAGPSPNGGPLAPSPVCKEDVAPPGGAVLSSWAALETVEGYS